MKLFLTNSMFCLLMSGCINRSVNEKCIYTIKEYKNSIKDTSFYTLNEVNGYTILNETKNDIGGIYTFNSDNELVSYKFMISPNSYSYYIDYTTGKVKGNILIYYEFVENGNEKYNLLLYFYGLNNNLSNFILKKDGKSKKITILDSDRNPNIKYASIHLKKYSNNNIHKAKYILEGQVYDCFNKSYILTDTITPLYP